MKRILSFALCIAMLFTIPLPANGAIRIVTPTITQPQEETYTNAATGISLTLPNGWSVKEIEDDDGDCVEFYADSDYSVSMQYSGSDMLEGYSEEEQEAYDREKICTELYTEEEIAEFLEVDEDCVKMVELGGKSYFQIVEEISFGRVYRVTKTTIYFLHIENGWLHIFVFDDIDENKLYDDFEQMVASAEYDGATNSNGGRILSRNDADIYKAAEKAYYDRDYATAYELFDSIEDYKDSDKYLRLLRIRMSCFNYGMGADVYCKELALSSSVKRDIDAAARDFYFADTAEVLVCNSDVACYYLLGRWEGGNKCYWQINTDAVGGYNYYIGSKLSTNYSSTFSIYEGVLTVDILGSCATVMTITLTAPDCMQVIACEKGGTCYTLTRK